MAFVTAWLELAAAPKNGKFYAVESSFEKKLGERFRFSPQAAITYFGILVSSCKVLGRGARLPRHGGR